MKRKLLTTILTISIAAAPLFGNSITANAEQSATLVQQLIDLTGNYIGYDMTYEDKVKVINSCFASSAAMQNYSLEYDSLYGFGNYSGPDTSAELPVFVGHYADFRYDQGYFAYDFQSNSLPAFRAYLISDGYYTALNAEKPVKSEESGKSYNLDVTFSGKLHECAFSAEQLASVAQYTEMDGKPYLVCSLKPEQLSYPLLLRKPGKDEIYDSANSDMTLMISLFNYGAYECKSTSHIIAGDKHYLYHDTYKYYDVLGTDITIE